MLLAPFLQRVIDRRHLTIDEARDAMGAMLEGEATAAQIASFLTALKMKGETAGELAGFAGAMRAKAVRLEVDGDLIDTCGTGGSGDGTFNISTIAAIVMAGAGARVAKHGNRSVTSSTGGSADMMEAFGVRFAMSPEDAVRAIREIGIGFLFAPHFHPAMKHAQPVRRELGVRTVFNLLGPLANPAGAQSQVIGAPSREAAKLMADALAMLGTRRSFVVHGHDGLDEISISGPTDVYEVRGTEVTKHVWSPLDFGVASASIGELRGGDGVRNAEIAREILGGAKGPRREIVLMNAAAGLVAGGVAKDLREGMERSAQSIDSSAAGEKLDRLRREFPD